MSYELHVCAIQKISPDLKTDEDVQAFADSLMLSDSTIQNIDIYKDGVLLANLNRIEQT